ncbi:MAG: acyl-[acyl-carrier-protein]--UDP-N-acetylglucosamine O-acyltransferase, partial [Holosporaceae bacterium]
PYGMVGPQDNTLNGLNVVGLKRQGTSQEAVRCLRRVYGVLFEDTAGTRQQRIEALDKEALSFQEVQDVLAFIQASDKRPLCLP